jgi:hypothetical protein
MVRWRINSDSIIIVNELHMHDKASQKCSWLNVLFRAEWDYQKPKYVKFVISQNFPISNGDQTTILSSSWLWLLLTHVHTHLGTSCDLDTRYKHRELCYHKHNFQGYSHKPHHLNKAGMSMRRLIGQYGPKVKIPNINLCQQCVAILK